MEQEFQLLVALPSDLANLALITLLPAADVAYKCGRGAAEGMLPNSACSLRLWQVDTARQVNSMQPGSGPLVAHSASNNPTVHAAVHVVCHKASAVTTFRALAALKQQLQLKVSRECLCLRLSSQDLQSAVHHVLLQTLVQAGWSRLMDSLLLRSNFLSAVEGEVCTCESVHMQIVPQPPNKLLLIVQPGVSRFRPLSVRRLLPEDRNPPSASTPSAELAALDAKLCSMQMPCTILPGCRPALLAGISPSWGTAAEEAEMRSAWRMHTGWELPEPIPHTFKVRFSADEDDAVTGVPSCCVWSAGGLTVVPATAKSGAAHAVLRRLAGDITGSPFQFWQGTALSISLVAGSGLGSSAGNAMQTAQWTSAKDVVYTAGQPEVACIETHIVPLSDLDPPAGEANGAIAASGAAQAVRRSAVKPSPALQAYLGTLPATEGGDTPKQPPKLPAVKAAHCSGHNRLQSAAPKASAAKPLLGKRPNGRSGALSMTITDAEERQRPTIGGGPSAADAVATLTTAAAARACAKPTFADHKRLGSKAGTAAPAKPPAQNKPNTVTGAERSATGKPPALTGTALAQQRAPAGAGVAPGAQQLAREAGNAGAAAAAAKAPPRKRTKAEDLDMAQVDAKVREKHASGQLDKLSIPELKCFLKARKQPLSGKKADLVARVTEVLATAK